MGANSYKFKNIDNIRNSHESVIFEKFGLIVDELELSVASRAEIRKKLQNNDFIYISGGNTFFCFKN